MSLIRQIAESPAGFLKNPDKDFTRNQKLPFEMIIQLIISTGGNSLYKELPEAQGYSPDTATTSAFVQQREKILPDAFIFLLHEFTKAYSDVKDYQGYRLLAGDASCLPVAMNSHNALYDLYSRVYVDAFIQPEKKMNEAKAIVKMVDRTQIDCIFSYFSYLNDIGNKTGFFLFPYVSL